jgi:hypothetical protein
MRILGTIVIAIAVFNSVIACAEDCSDKSPRWADVQKNLQWTVFDDAAARSCYYNDTRDGKNAYDALMDCNDRWNANANQSKDHLNKCWPANVCNWLKARNAPGC